MFDSFLLNGYNLFRNFTLSSSPVGYAFVVISSEIALSMLLTFSSISLFWFVSYKIFLKDLPLFKAILGIANKQAIKQRKEKKRKTR